MDAVQILQIVKELTESLDQDVKRLRSEFHSATLDQSVKFAKIEATSEANQTRLEALDRVVIRGNGVESLQATVRRMDARLTEISSKLSEIEKAVQATSGKDSIAPSPSPKPSSNSVQLISLLSDQKFWLSLFGVIVTALTAWGAYQESQSPKRDEQPAIESPANPDRQ